MGSSHRSIRGVRYAMQETVEFLQVDNNVRSRTPLPAIIEAVEAHDKLMLGHVGREGRSHLVTFNHPLPARTVTKAITNLVKTITAFPPSARREWKAATHREFDIGIRSGAGQRGEVYGIDADAIAAIHALAARIVLTVYPATNSISIVANRRMNAQMKKLMTAERA